MAVIGAGEAGRSAATAAAGFGLDVLLFEQFSVDPALPPNVQVLDRTPVWGQFPGWTIAASRDGEPLVVTVESVILATGSTDKTAPFAGGSQPGVITAGGLQQLVHVHRLLPGQRFVVAGDGEDADAAIQCIEAAGGEVVLRVAEANVRLMIAYGPDGIERVVSGDERVEADIVVMAIGRTPDLLLAAMAGCELGFDPGSQTWVVKRNAALESSAPGIWVAGDIAGCTDVSTARAEGRFAAAQVARRRGVIKDEELELERRVFESSVASSRLTGFEGSVTSCQPWAPELMDSRNDGG